MDDKCGVLKDIKDMTPEERQELYEDLLKFIDDCNERQAEFYAWCIEQEKLKDGNII